MALRRSDAKGLVKHMTEHVKRQRKGKPISEGQKEQLTQRGW